MGPFVAAYVFSMAALGLGALTCVLAFGMPFIVKIVTAWTIFLTAAYFTNMPILVLVLIVYALSIKDQPIETKIIYFVGLIPVLPLQTYIVPFPGINYLWDLSFYRALVLVLFISVYINSLSLPADKKIPVRSTDYYFYAFIVLMALMSLRSGNLISAIRGFISLMADFGIPYYIISRYLRSPQILNWVFCAIVFSATVLTFASAIEGWRVWRFMSQIFYSLNLQFDAVALVPYSRDGVIRAAGGTMFIPLAFAFFVALANVICFYFWKARLLRFFPAMLLMSVCFMGLILTDSKGGILAFLCGVFVLYHARLGPGMKFVVNVILLVAIPSVMGYLIATEFKTIDSEGSFGYRYQLVINSFDAISQNPILGSDNFADNPSLRRSLQGEGIVDIVNLYLQVLLQYGFVGLFLYVMIFASLIKGVLKKPPVVGVDHKDIILALMVAIMVFIATASNASFIPFYITLVWAIARAYMEFPQQQAVEHRMVESKAVVRGV